MWTRRANVLVRVSFMAERPAAQVRAEAETLVRQALSRIRLE
ncbi:hypothetical protein GCM10009780_17380 [Actinomadura alba]